MKKLFYGLLLLLVLMELSCSKGLSDYNLNPNTSTEGNAVNPDNILPAAVINPCGQVFGYVGTEFANLAVQHMAKATSIETDQYTYPLSSLDVFWLGMYAEGLVDFEKVRSLAGSNQHYAAIAEVMQCWIFGLLTDIYGDVPYKEAIAGRSQNIAQPVFDKQEEIYKDLLARLKAANEKLDPSGPAVKGDIIYSGDILKWKRFCNSLRFRMLMRLSAKQDRKADLQEMIADVNKYPMMSAVTDNFQMKYLAVTGNEHPFYLQIRTSNPFRVSKKMVDLLQSTDDPRLQVYAAPAESGGGYAGYPNGQTGLNQLQYSKPGAHFTRANANGVLFSYSELLFLKAEAALKQFTTGDHVALYKQAIKASMDEYNGVSVNGQPFVAPDINSTFFNGPGIALTGANDLEKIMTQKWVALYGHNWEPWIEWKRTGYPALAASAGNTNSGKIPVRMPYPTTEQNYNATNYQEAVSRQGADNLNTRIWWNK